MLQPHEGPSETGPSATDGELAGGFNPTRVRLKHILLGTPVLSFESFNPTRVRLKLVQIDQPRVPLDASTPRGSV